MEKDLAKLVMPAAIMLGSTIALLIFRSIILYSVKKWSDRTKTKIDDVILEAIRTPSIFWCAAVGIVIGIDTVEMPPKYALYLPKALHVLIIISITSAISTISGKLIEAYVERLNVPLPATGLAQTVLKGLIYATGIIIALSAINISIAPLVTALGIGGLAIALALQETLSNLFAGIHLLVDRPIRVGDFIKLESGQEGYVEDVTWRTTRIRMLSNNIVIIPNNKLSQSLITNYHLPEKRMSLLIKISVGYSSDVDTVERVVIEEVLLATKDVPGLLAEPAPFVRFIPGFGESSLDLTLICQVAEFVDQYLAQHELRKRILRRFNAEGIEIPFPQRTVHIKEEK